MFKPVSETEADFASDVIDVTGVYLSDLDDMESSVFDAAVRRVIEVGAGPTTAKFQAATPNSDIP